MGRSVGWLTGPSLDELRRGVAELVPDLAGKSLRLNDRVVTSNPRYFQGSAVIDGAYVVKFAWSEQPARRIVHEGEVLTALATMTDPVRVPAVVAAGATPALLVSRLVPGEPVSWEAANQVSGDQRRRLTDDLAAFLTRLHDWVTLEAVGPAAVGPEAPEPQATTEELRARFGRYVTSAQRQAVASWCDWVDEVLAAPVDLALLHGDLHGHNIVWDRSSGAVRLVTDFESAGVGDPAFDFRYLPGQAATVDLFLEVAGRYGQISGRVLDLERVMAWHVRTVLGDALWRSDGGVLLPGGGGTASSWVDDLGVRMAAVLGRSGGAR